ncbi:SDR family NAD(P)-dependent oxidoreductase [Nocardioides sp. LS1]|uniref:SDR family NAD(P)-dependent oxidoreductase n=1 Tax=Nocardioides sp. LS1 TaxID=1027620 RepID=UPI000F625CFB|nr:SDR family oxidoreductase [Nocardioides sp. LS1]GCD90000.1 short-chain dehydrogenase [Nocardioides sp. LS1]
MPEPVGGRSALVTGASRGIGLGIARMLAGRGFSLTVAARDAGRLATVADELRCLGASRVVPVPGDLADQAYPAVLATSHRDAFGSLDCLVLSAGVGTAGNLADFPVERFDKTVAVNVRAPFLLVQECLPLLRAAALAHPDRGARVVALSSITGVHAEPGLAAYGATKAALNSLVETLNAEESGRGVSATALAPAYVETDMSAWVRDVVPAEEMIPVSDIVELVAALVGLSARSVVSRLVISRAGTTGFGA